MSEKKKYKTGLVLGKFMPLHYGHMGLIDHGISLCEELIILVCTTENEPIPGEQRYNWVSELYRNKPVVPIHFVFDEHELPSTSVPAADISKVWAQHILKFIPKVDVFISSEKYGEIVASYMGIENEYYDTTRDEFDISATQVRQNPYFKWDMIPPPVQDFFFKKVVIVGTESTGKTELCKRLAKYYGSDWVHEVGRDIVTDIHLCTKEDLQLVATEHAKNIIIAEKKKNKLLFIDTDVNVTKSYFNFLFKGDMEVDRWTEIANKGDLYIYLEPDSEYVQDGTRLNNNDRKALDRSHKVHLSSRGINYFSVYGNDWQEREKMARDIIWRELIMPYTIGNKTALALKA